MIITYVRPDLVQRLGAWRPASDSLDPRGEAYEIARAFTQDPATLYPQFYPSNVPDQMPKGSLNNGSNANPTPGIPRKCGLMQKLFNWRACRNG